MIKSRIDNLEDYCVVARATTDTGEVVVMHNHSSHYFVAVREWPDASPNPLTAESLLTGPATIVWTASYLPPRTARGVYTEALATMAAEAAILSPSMVGLPGVDDGTNAPR